MTFNYIAIGWNTAVVLAVLFYGHHLLKIFHWSFVLAVIYTLLQGFGFAAYTAAFRPYAPAPNMTLSIHYWEAFATVLLAVVIMEKMRVRDRWMIWICVTNVVLTTILIPWDIYRENHSWLMGLSVNPGMNGAITAVTLPFLLLLYPAWLSMSLIVLGIFLLFYSGASTPVLAGIASVLLPLIVCKRVCSRRWEFPLFLIAFTCVLAVFVPDFSSSTGRIGQWTVLFRSWRDLFNPLIGSGNGSFHIWGPTIQHWDGTRLNYYLWMHCDILQTLFELGVIGLALWANAFIFMVINLRNKPLWLGAGAAWLATACTYYPIHFPIQLFLGMCIASIAIKREYCYQKRALPFIKGL